MTIARPTKTVQHLDWEEIDLQPFDFGRSLAPGESIASAAVGCTVHAGADENATQLLQGAPQIVGTQVLQMVLGRISGVTYHLRCVATLSSGRKVVAACYLPCVTL